MIRITQTRILNRNPYRQRRRLPLKRLRKHQWKRTKKNCLESLLLGVYVKAMPSNDHVELLTRTVVILAMALAFDDRLTPEESVEKVDQFIHDAKVQALRDMEIAEAQRVRSSEGITGGPRGHRLRRAVEEDF